MNNLENWYNNFSIELKRDLKSYYNIDLIFLKRKLDGKRYNFTKNCDIFIKPILCDNLDDGLRVLFTIEDVAGSKIIYAEVICLQPTSSQINRFGK